LSDLQIVSVSHVLLPDAKNLGDGITLEEANVSDDVKKRGLMHPV